jgi:beta-galactosidase
VPLRGFEGRLCYGGDYNPEQWPEHVWVEDVQLMRQCGVNLVTVGVFAWSMLEPAPGQYEFGWLDRVLDLLHDNGISVVLATPTASPPPWFGFAHPDALPVTRDGVRLVHGSRDAYCPSAPAYRAAARRIATALAQRYAGHPALALWHVHNEYGTVCYCDHAAAAFRRWLRDRYGTLDALNEAWTTAFWSQRYADWEHVLPPRATPYLANPAQLLDFRRFCSDELLACFREQRDVLRELTPDVPVTTNFAIAPWVPIDPWAWAREVDLVAIDHYPSSNDGLAAEEETAFVADLARGWAGGRTWLLMEQAPDIVHNGGWMVPKRPGQLTRLSLSHVARGSLGVMNFQWRASPGGAEAFMSAMVPHAGPDARSLREVTHLGAQLANLGRHDGPVAADVALVWDPHSWWALQGPGLPAPGLDYWAMCRHVHGSAWRLGVTVDIVAPGEPLSGYRLVLVPALFLTTASAADAIKSFVDSGGHVVVWYLSGVADTNVRVHRGGWPGLLATTLGVRVERHYPLPHQATVALDPAGTGSSWSELVRPEGAEALLRYAKGDLAGEPAVTVHAGRAWYVSTRLDDATQQRFLAQVFAAANVAPAAPGAGHGVEVVRRGQRLYAINHTTSPAEIGAPSQGSQTGLRIEPGTYLVTDVDNLVTDIDSAAHR